MILSLIYDFTLWSENIQNQFMSFAASRKKGFENSVSSENAHQAVNYLKLTAEWSLYPNINKMKINDYAYR